jgi:hypothetical protein
LTDVNLGPGGGLFPQETLGIVQGRKARVHRRLRHGTIFGHTVAMSQTQRKQIASEAPEKT